MVPAAFRHKRIEPESDRDDGIAAAVAVSRATAALYQPRALVVHAVVAGTVRYLSGRVRQSVAIQKLSHDYRTTNT